MKAGSEDGAQHLDSVMRVSAADGAELRVMLPEEAIRYLAGVAAREERIDARYPESVAVMVDLLLMRYGEDPSPSFGHFMNFEAPDPSQSRGYNYHSVSADYELRTGQAELANGVTPSRITVSSYARDPQLRETFFEGSSYHEVAIQLTGQAAFTGVLVTDWLREDPDPQYRMSKYHDVTEDLCEVAMLLLRRFGGWPGAHELPGVL